MGSMGTIGNNMPHWYSFDCSVNITGNPPPSPPFPPSNPVNIEYKYGAGGTWTAFPGTPANMGGIYTKNLLTGLANGDTFYVRVY